jgi:hypothetical protein
MPLGSLGFFAFLLAISPLSALPNDGSLLIASVGVSIEDFHYEEENRRDEIIAREDGRLPGLSFDLAIERGNWWLASQLRYSEGEIDYLAYPATSHRLYSATREEIRELSVHAGYQHQSPGKTRFRYFVGLGLRIWDRDIRSLDDIAGLDETYEWPYLSLGIQPTFDVGPRSSLSLLLQANKAFDASLEVTFKEQRYDPVSLALDEGLGLRLVGTWTLELDQSAAVGFGPYLDLWWFDRSEPQPLTRNGILVGSVHEPQSLTRNLGLQLFIRKRLF